METDVEDIREVAAPRPLSIWRYLACFCMGVSLPSIVLGTLLVQQEGHPSTEPSWPEGTAWTIHVRAHTMTTVAELTVVRNADDSQTLATTSPWTALTHAFDDNIPFLGRIERENFAYYENGDRQELMRHDAAQGWTARCFDIPFSLRRSSRTVTGTSVHNDASLTVHFGADGFLETLHLQSRDRPVVIKRLSSAFTPEGRSWFARSTSVVNLANCSRGTHLLPQRVMDRSLLALRLRWVRGIVVVNNVSTSASGMSWIPLTSRRLEISECLPTTSIAVVAIDMFQWDHALARPQIVYEW